MDGYPGKAFAFHKKMTKEKPYRPTAGITPFPISKDKKEADRHLFSAEKHLLSVVFVCI